MHYRIQLSMVHGQAQACKVGRTTIKRLSLNAFLK